MPASACAGIDPSASNFAKILTGCSGTRPLHAVHMEGTVMSGYRPGLGQQLAAFGRLLVAPLRERAVVPARELVLEVPPARPPGLGRRRGRERPPRLRRRRRESERPGGRGGSSPKLRTTTCDLRRSPRRRGREIVDAGRSRGLAVPRQHDGRLAPRRRRGGRAPRDGTRECSRQHGRTCVRRAVAATSCAEGMPVNCPCKIARSSTRFDTARVPFAGKRLRRERFGHTVFRSEQSGPRAIEG